MSNKLFVALLFFLTLALSACGKRAATLAAQNTETKSANQESQDAAFDVCGLIKNDEIQTIQGSPIKETKSSGHSNAGFQTAQCFYLAEEFSSSVSLSVTRTDPNSPGKASLKEFWEQTFGRHAAEEKEGKGDKEKKESLREQRREREEEGRPLQKIAGIGEEAYWSGSRVGGALYVLKKNAFVRVSVGGPDPNDKKIEKSKALAQKAIDRL